MTLGPFLQPLPGMFKSFVQQFFFKPDTDSVLILADNFVFHGMGFPSFGFKGQNDILAHIIGGYL